MQPMCIASQTSIELRGDAISGATDRHRQIIGFDQDVFSSASVLCVGAGGLISMIAPTLLRKGIGRITLLDDDVVETSNLNRQRFYTYDVGKHKAVALARNLRQECIAPTEICGYAIRLEDAIERPLNLKCDVVVCGVDNNPARVTAGRYFRDAQTPVIFAAVSRDADHGYVFVQEHTGPCIACLFPDIVNDDRFPCPGTPAIADILQAVGSMAVYAVDSLLMQRPRHWNYRRISLSGGSADCAALIPARPDCAICGGRN